MQVSQIEGGEGMELAVLLGEELGLPLAQELEGGPEPAARAQGALGDGALHAHLTRGQPNDLRGLAVAERR